MRQWVVLHIGNSLDGGGGEMVFRQTIESLREYSDSNYNHLVACSLSRYSKIDINLTLIEHKGLSIMSKINQVFSIRNYFLLKKFLNREKPLIIHLQNYGNLSPSVLKAVYDYKRKHDVIVFHTLHTFELICSHYAAFDYKKNKRCLDCQASNPRLKIFYRRCSRGGAIHSWGKGVAALIADWFYRRNVVDHWIAPSFFMRQVILPRVKDSNRITVLQNPIKSYFLIANESYEHKHSTLVYFGRLSNEKNVSLLIDALRIYKDLFFDLFPINVIIIGDGDQKAELIHRISQYDLKFIEFIPFLDTEELVKHINTAKVSVLPSKCFENFPLFIIESVINNIFPIVADHGGMRELIDWIEMGEKFISGDAVDLSNRIFVAFKDYELRKGAFCNAKDKIRRFLDPEIYALNLVSLYNRMLNKHAF